MNLGKLSKDSDHLYNVAITIATIGLVLLEFATSTAVAGTAVQTSLNTMITSILGIADWTDIIIILIVAYLFRQQKKKG